MLSGIQMLRAVAAIYVVLYHCALKVGVSTPFYTNGSSGVDLFFVISGFVIAYSVAGKTEQPGRFLARRIIRIVPLYWFLTGSFVLLLLLAPGIFQTYRFNLQHLLASLFFQPQSVYPVIYPGWTLVYEMYFYVLFALFLALFRARASQLLVLFLAASAALGALLPSPPSSPYFELISSEMLLEFCTGLLFFHLYQRGVRIPPIIAALLIACAALSAWLLREHSRLYAYGLPWALVFAAVTFCATNFRQRQLAFLGDASYSIYLVQAFSIPAMQFIAKKLAPLITLQGEPLVWLYMLASVIAGVCVYLILEQPVTRTLKLWLEKPAPLSAQITAVAD